MPDLSFLSTLTLTRLRITFKALEPIVLPEYKGSAFRGCLGETLRRVTCTRPGQPCITCSERFGCPFSVLYNSFVEPGHPHARKFANSPHPYIIEPEPGSQTFFGTGETFRFSLVLIGSAIKLFPVLASALGKMGETGIGKGRGRFVPVKLESFSNNGEYRDVPVFGGPVILTPGGAGCPGTGNRLMLGFETPLRLKAGGKPATSPPGFELFVDRLAQRLSLLAHFHCGAEWCEIPQGEAEGITIYESKLQWADWRRYSGTQDTKMNFDGFVGEITWEGNFNQWMPLIAAGEWLHAGLTATFGLGKYSIL